MLLKKVGEVDFLLNDYENLSALPIEIKSDNDQTNYRALPKLVNSDLGYSVPFGYVFGNKKHSKEGKEYNYRPHLHGHVHISGFS